MIYLDPAKRHDFVLFFDVKNGNPNGDPDAGNLPRMDPQTMKGIVTDVCLKRKVRDYIQLSELGDNYKIFIQSEVALNTLIEKAAREAVGIEPPKEKIDDKILNWFQEDCPNDFDLDGNIVTYVGESFEKKQIEKALLENVEDKDLKKELRELATKLAKAAKGKLGEKERIATREKMIREYFDIRMFGAVLSTGLNAGQVRGPMQLTFAQSIDPIFPLDLGITRVAITREQDKHRKETEMGRKPILSYALYRAHGFYNPFLGAPIDEKGTGVSENDLKVFWRALVNMFELNRTASKGHMAVRGLYVFTHNSKLGNAASHKLFELIGQENKKNGVPESFGDYGIVPPTKEGVKEKFKGNITLTNVLDESEKLLDS